MKGHPDLQKQQGARTAICRECSEGTAFTRDTWPNHPSAQSANGICVADELPRGSVPRTSLATSCYFSRTQETWHPQEQQRHLTLPQPQRQPATCPSPKSLPRAKQTVQCTLTSPRSEQRQVAAPSRRGCWASTWESTPKLVLHLTPQQDTQRSGKTRTTCSGKCPQVWDQFNWQQASLGVNLQPPGSLPWQGWGLWLAESRVHPTLRVSSLSGWVGDPQYSSHRILIGRNCNMIPPKVTKYGFKESEEY